MLFASTRSNPLRPANPPERGPRADNETKAAGNEFGWYRAGTQKVPTGGESNKTAEGESALICLQPSERGRVSVQQGARN